MRGLILIALLALIGTATTGWIVARSGVAALPRADAVISGWLARLPGLLAWFLLMLSLLRGALQVLAFNDPGMPVDPELAKAVLSTGSWGTGWIVQTATAFILLGTSWLLRRSPDRLRLAVVALTLVVLVAQAGMGHGVEGRWTPAGLGQAVHFTHLVAAGLWLGTLAVLAIAVLPSLQTEEARPILAGVIQRFSRFGQAGAGLLALSGAVAAWTYTSSLTDLWTSPWGRLLSIKLLLLVGVAALGWYNWKIVTPRLAAGSPPAGHLLRRAIAIELLLGLCVVAVTAVLVATALPGEG